MQFQNDLKIFIDSKTPDFFSLGFCFILEIVYRNCILLVFAWY